MSKNIKSSWNLKLAKENCYKQERGLTILIFFRDSKSWRYLNRCIGSKVTAILLNGWILPTGGVALGRVCRPACAAALFNLAAKINLIYGKALFIKRELYLSSFICHLGSLCNFGYRVDMLLGYFRGKFVFQPQKPIFLPKSSKICQCMKDNKHRYFF